MISSFSLCTSSDGIVVMSPLIVPVTSNLSSVSISSRLTDISCGCRASEIGAHCPRPAPKIRDVPETNRNVKAQVTKMASLYISRFTLKLKKNFPDIQDSDMQLSDLPKIIHCACVEKRWVPLGNASPSSVRDCPPMRGSEVDSGDGVLV